MKEILLSEISLLLNTRIPTAPLLVFVSIILLHFSLVIFANVTPCSCYYPRDSTRALGDIKWIELALTKVLNDAQLHTGSDLFNPDEVADYLADGIVQGGTNPVRIAGVLTTYQFQRAQDMYTRTFYALLNHGRNVLEKKDKAMGIFYADVLWDDRIEKLESSYLDALGSDPWGNSYRIFPGPWPQNMISSEKDKEPNGNLNIFRIHLNLTDSQGFPGHKSTASQRDALTVNYNPLAPDSLAKEVEAPEIDDYEIFGYPAPRDKMVFIYSFGQNMVSGQAVYSNSGYSWRRYDHNQEPMYCGGGDDINNWDRDQTFMIFYQ